MAGKEAGVVVAIIGALGAVAAAMMSSHDWFTGPTLTGGPTASASAARLPPPRAAMS